MRDEHPGSLTMRQIEDEANIGFRHAETRKNSNFLIRESGAVSEEKAKTSKDEK